jgi:hypothetical protein
VLIAKALAVLVRDWLINRVARDPSLVIWSMMELWRRDDYPNGEVVTVFYGNWSMFSDYGMDEANRGWRGIIP